ncbi:MAG: type III-B CRISPR module RAMP protein Cmr6 [Bacteroidetes bacterium]|nr:type III-B CRISPR module RAMP protein Cmr6 [Bacteroidota bacterium]
MEVNQNKNILIREGPVIPDPTYSLVKDILSGSQENVHTGLMLDKFSIFPQYSSRQNAEGTMETQKDALLSICESMSDQSLLSELNARRIAMLSAMDAQLLSMRTQGALTLHLSRPGVWENAGILLHPIYGFVYLTGSGLKGLARSYAETVWAPAQSNEESAWHSIEEAFGFTTSSEGHKIQTHDSGWRPSEIPFPDCTATGRLIFHDAWPSKWPQLEVDIANSHHSKYYQGHGQHPDDTEDTIPVYFLAVGSGVEFQFAVSDRKHHSNSLVEQGICWLRDALIAEGVGAKTAAGYGHFIADKMVNVAQSHSVIRREHDLELISMAFLAGANQSKEDCDLRPATLRGLLRWWWRTMHTGHVDLDTLRNLESAIWGDTDRGSPVQILLDRVFSPEIERFNKNKIKRDLNSQHSGYRANKTNLGLAYASYGMDERDRKSQQRKQRWYMQPGSKWHLTVNTRSGYYISDEGKKRLKPEIIHRQVDAALWLFAKYGGAGSRSRKGFGSFEAIPIKGINSIDDCKKIGESLRKKCKVYSSGNVRAPNMEEAIIYKSQPVTNYPNLAISWIGEIIQNFAKQLKDEGCSRESLGLPRKSNLQRHASPAVWSLSRDKNGDLSIQLIGFPSDKLPDSEQVLKDLCRYAEERLKEKHFISISSQQEPRSARVIASNQLDQNIISAGVDQKSSRPSTGDHIRVVVLDEKTKKGNVKAKHLDSGLIGSMVDTNNEPNDIEVGQEKVVIVHSVNENTISFRWEPLPRKKKLSLRK